MIAEFNQRFGKLPRNDHDAHRALCADDDLRQILGYRLPRKVINALTVQYDRVMYLLEDSPANRTLIHEYIEVVEYAVIKMVLCLRLAIDSKKIVISSTLKMTGSLADFFGKGKSSAAWSL